MMMSSIIASNISWKQERILKQKEHKKWIDKQLKFKEERAFMNTIIDDSKNI